ncbi:MAG: hypothetical protein ACI8QZ_003379 [Chlamydiales bacterium]|jgi:hypothetical protein
MTRFTWWLFVCVISLGLGAYWLFTSGAVETGQSVVPDIVQSPVLDGDAGALSVPEKLERTTAASSAPSRVLESTTTTAPALRGRVAFEDGGRPYAEMRVGVWGPNGSQRQTTDSEGRFRLATVHAGTYRFSVADEEGRALGWVLLEDTFDFSAATSDQVLEVDLRIARAGKSLEVRVGFPSDSADTCQVSFACLGSFIRTRTCQRSSGVVRFGYREEELKQELSLWAADGQGYFSEFRSIQRDALLPLESLVLKPGAVVDLRLWTHDGTVAEGEQVLLNPRTDQAAYEGGAPKVTNGEGRVSFEGLPPCQTAVAVLGMNGSFVTYEELDLFPGQRLALDITLVENRPLAVQGLVLDEQGKPLAGRAIVLEQRRGSRTWNRTASTDGQGVFKLHGAECDSILIRANLDPEGDLFDPDHLRVDFGDKKAVFRRVNAAPKESFRLEVIDAVTKQFIEEVSTTFDRGPGTYEWGITYAPRSEFEVPVQEGSRLHVCGEGYRGRVFSLAETLAQLGAERTLRVELKPGLEFRLRVLDLESNVALSQVLFRSANGKEFRSNEEGVVSFDDEVWSVFEVLKKGYEPDSWDPSKSILWGADRILLTPVEGDR